MHIGLLALVLIVGVVLGRLFRSDPPAKKEIAINAERREALETRQSEHAHLVEQNRGLMDQISQYRASHKVAVSRTNELSVSLKNAIYLRDELQQQLNEFRNNLQVTTGQRNKLSTAIDNFAIQVKRSASDLKEKDDKIFRLSRELASWQNRVPPLVEKYRARDKQAQELESQLERARTRIESLEELARSVQASVESVDEEVLADGLDASNEPHDDTSAHTAPELQDQIHVTDDDDKPLVELEALDNYAESGDETDDLKQIKGVGPAIERTLNDLGIFYFNQIAEMSEYEIDRVAQQLKGFRSRIYREDWPGQARDLQYQKNNELS